MLNKVDSQSSGHKVFLVTRADQTEDIVTLVKDASARDAEEEVVLGMDCEGLHINKPLSLIQVSSSPCNNHCRCTLTVTHMSSICYRITHLTPVLRR